MTIKSFIIATGAAVLSSAGVAQPLPDHRPIVVIDAPSNLGLRPPKPGVIPGVYQLPAALRRNGIVERLDARDGGSVEPPAYSPEPDRAVGFRNGSALARYTADLAARVSQHAGKGEFVVVLGGDCSVLLGSTLGLRRLGRYGLVFIDGHDDYSYVRDRKRYAGLLTAAGLDLGLATGHGADALSNIDGLRPYIEEADVVQVGLSREKSDIVFFATETFDESAIRRFPIDRVRKIGARTAGETVRADLEARPTKGFFIHVDADVLDASVMPAVDSPNPDGMDYDQLTDVLAELLRSPRAVGLELTILDPDLDPDGRYARRFTDAVVEAFRRAGRLPPVG